MLKATFTSIVILLSLASCSSTQVEKIIVSSNYERDFIYPKNTQSLVFINQQTYEQPLYGSSLRYENRYFDQDEVSVYTYPIRHFYWQNNNHLLESEMNNIFMEIDNAVDQGIYHKRIGKDVETFEVSETGKMFNGLRATTKIVLASGAEYNSYSYLFMQKDKFIKFRISQPNAGNFIQAPDNIIEELLPQISVPGESSYMAQLRLLHKQEYEQTMSKN
ncbi:hypothetical protein [Algibacillus agarilyticus]|uniref:hypothetical protein n=1 Tax=Algibacillus agarilyticus TaxID=2234133 RepID=UPI000DD00631|nr:hypothetical protein [Algibacillus agarilyticus]